MTLYVYTMDRTAEDLPIHVDDSTSVTLNDDNEIVVKQHGPAGYVENRITVADVDALTRALTQAQLVQAERQAMDGRPMTDDMRKAIFAALNDRYGRDIIRERRLAIVSAILSTPGNPREVVTLSTNPRYVDLTRADASHVLDVLNA